MKLSLDKRELVDFALRRTGAARLAMRGTSMLPLLREPYVLDVRRPPRKLRIGDVVLFEWDRRLVAHRIVDIQASVVVCAGDAHPDCVERISRHDVLGIVASVRATSEPRARRVDGPAFTARGWIYARSRRLRAFLMDALPWVRPRAYASLAALLGAIVRDDDAELARVLAACDVRRVAFLARRHRCAAVLREALRRSGDERARSLSARLEVNRWATAVRARKLREQLREVVAALNAANLTPVLLKGAARLWCEDAQADLHDSVDLDVLVDGSEISNAREALMRAGYREKAVDAGDFYAHHHHAPPLFPPGGGVSVELHHALAPRAALTTDVTFAAIEDLFVDASRDEGRARRLDRVGTAFHLIVHGFRRYMLRDLYLLARLLRAMSAEERSLLQRRLDGERIARVQMSAMAAHAASLAHIPWNPDRHAARFRAWAECREELPGPLRCRPQCYDAWMASGGRSIVRRWRAIWTSSGLDYIDGRPHRALRFQGRRVLMLAAGAVIAAYVPLMRRV